MQTGKTVEEPKCNIRDLIKEINILNLKKGDIIVFRIKKNVRKEFIDKKAEEISKGTGYDVIVLPDGDIEIDLIKKEV